MKINWGRALLIFFVIYIGLLVRIVIKSTTIDHSLVVENYYQHDIDYQKKVNKVQNRSLLPKDISIRYNAAGNEIAIDFGKDYAAIKNATLHMYRASDKNLDFDQEIPILDKEVYLMNLPKLKNGRWKLSVNWEDKNRAYLKEEDIYIQGV